MIFEWGVFPALHWYALTPRGLDVSWAARLEVRNSLLETRRSGAPRDMAHPNHFESQQISH